MIKFFIAVVLLIQYDLNIWWWVALITVSLLDVYARSVADDTNTTILNNQKVIEEEIVKLHDLKKS